MNFVDGNLGNPLTFGMPSIPTFRKSLFDYENPLTKLHKANKSNTDFLNRKPQSLSPFKAPIFFIAKGSKTIVTTQGQLKKATQTSRIIHIIGEAASAQSINLYSDISYSNAIKAEFVKKGWDVKSVQFEWKSDLKVYWFRVVVNVQSAFSNADVQGRAFEILQNFSTYLGSAWFSNIKISLEVGDTAPANVTPYTQPKSTDKQSGGGNGNGSGGSLIDGIGNTLSNAVTGWATASGYLLPVAALGTIIVLALAIKVK
jgi:hypothetical protein